MHIAVADGEEIVRDFMSSLLTSAGYRCSLFGDSNDLKHALQHDSFDLIIVGWITAGLSGLDLIRWAREALSPCPRLIMLANQSGKTTIIEALNAGADDYIIEPETEHVILARVDAIMRRPLYQPGKQPRIEQFGCYSFNHMAGTVILNNEEIALTSREFQLAHLFFKSPDRAFSRAYILATLWNSVPDLHTRTLDMHISRIRSKLRLEPENGYRLQTIFGHGYRLETFDGEE
tara:strand:- start:15844 stop:16542 length:699 start_codon:yes stop_codon:yes gene_type:complete